MRDSTAHHRPPRAGVDPILDASAALAALTLAVTRPLRHETIVLLLDDARRGVALVVVSGTSRPDDVIGVVECLADPLAHGGGTHAIVIASVRPGHVDDDPADVDRWLEMSDLADAAGIQLLEWFVFGGTVGCPRDRLAEPPRW